MSKSIESHALHVAMAVEAGFLELVQSLEDGGELKPGEGNAIKARAGAKLTGPLASDNQLIAAGIVQRWLAPPKPL